MISTCYDDSEEGCKKYVPGLGSRLWISVQTQKQGCSVLLLLRMCWEIDFAEAE